MALEWSELHGLNKVKKTKENKHSNNIALNVKVLIFFSQRRSQIEVSSI